MKLLDLGDQTGDWLGRRLGPGMLRRTDSRIFKQEDVERAKVSVP
jgi:membrane protein DedA with SNARE-associated domain